MKAKIIKPQRQQVVSHLLLQDFKGSIIELLVHVLFMKLWKFVKNEKAAN